MTAVIPPELVRVTRRVSAAGYRVFDGTYNSCKETSRACSVLMAERGWVTEVVRCELHAISRRTGELHALGTVRSGIPDEPLAPWGGHLAVRLRLRLAARWPWASQITDAISRLQALAPG